MCFYRWELVPLYRVWLCACIPIARFFAAFADFHIWNDNVSAQRTHAHIVSAILIRIVHRWLPLRSAYVLRTARVWWVQCEILMNSRDNHLLIECVVLYDTHKCCIYGVYYRPATHIDTRAMTTVQRNAKWVQWISERHWHVDIVDPFYDFIVSTTIFVCHRILVAQHFWTCILKFNVEYCASAVAIWLCVSVCCFQIRISIGTVSLFWFRSCFWLSLFDLKVNCGERGDGRCGGELTSNCIWRKV